MTHHSADRLVDIRNIPLLSKKGCAKRGVVVYFFIHSFIKNKKS